MTNLQDPLLVPQEDATRVFNKITSKPVNSGLELFADLFERFRVEGAAQRMVEVIDQLRMVCWLGCD